MKTADKKAFAETLVGACAVYDRRPLEAAAIRIYWECLLTYSLEDLHGAMVRHIETSKFFPKPAELIQLIDGTVETQAVTAWIVVMEAIRRVGSWGVSTFEDPMINLSIQALGGWKQLCLMRESEVGFVQKRFEDAYTACRQDNANGKLLTVDRLKLLADDARTG